MIKTPLDALLVLAICSGAACFVGGYGLLVCQALRHPERRKALKRVLDWRGHEHEMDPRGLLLIFIGACIGAITFLSIGVGAFVWGCR